MDFRIKEICKQKGILFKDLAKQIGVTDVGLRQSLQGNPTMGTLEKIASALNVELWELFTASTENGDFMALVKSGNRYYHATTLSELENIVEQLKI